jgi:hypothetical protein
VAKKRVTIPKTVQDSVLKEFNHRCALCGEARPHLHHLDEDPSNNDPQNLIPLCPNCHLADQHDASNAIPLDELKLFREFKNRQILKPQFKAILKRMNFLSRVQELPIREVEERGRELVEFVSIFTMGEFYAKQLNRLLECPRKPAVWGLDAESQAQRQKATRLTEEIYKERLIATKPEIVSLIIEMLNYQTWPDESRTARQQ